MSHESVGSLVSALNYEWFQRKKECFVKETFFSQKQNKIYEVLEENSILEDDDVSPVEFKEDIVIDIDLSKYCWYDKYPHSRSGDEQDETVFPVNGSSISYYITEYLNTTTKNINNDVGVIQKIILSTIDEVKDTIQELLQGNNDEEYTDALNFFLINCLQDISKKYGHIKMAYDISEKYVDKLAFNLNQEELGALLYILYRADILEVSTPGDTTFLNFCSSHFYFKNQKKGTFTAATGIRNKFNDAKNKAAHKARDGVIQKLKDAFKDL